MKEKSMQELINNFKLDDNIKLKIWIKTLLVSYKIFPNIISTIDKIINLQATSLSFTTNIYNYSKSTKSQIDRVIDMSERKKSLINIYLMVTKIFENLSVENKEFAERKYIDKYTNDELAVEFDISPRTVYRRLSRINDEIYSYFKRVRWTVAFVESQVNNEEWLIEKYNYFVKEYISNQNILNFHNKSSSES